MAGISRPTNEVLGRLAFLANTRGIIPNPITATRIDRTGNDIVNSTNILYTVPEGQQLFISSAWCATRNDSAGSTGIWLLIRNAADVTVFFFVVLGLRATSQDSWSNQYSPGIEVAAGFDVCLVSPAADVHAFGGFSGWVEDA